MRGPTASAATVLGIVRFVQAEPAAVLRAVGLSPGLTSDDRVPARALVDVMAEAVHRTEDPALGLRIASTSHPQRFDVMGYLFSSAPTLREAWSTLPRTLRLWNGGFALQVHEGRQEVELALRCVIPRVRADTPGLQPLSELALTTTLLTARHATGVPLVPLRAYFLGHPDDATHLRALFGEDLRFGAPHNALVFDRGALDLPLQQADPRLAAILARHADELLARLPDEGGPVARSVRAELARRTGEAPELSVLARALGTSARTLQRRLRDEGVTYQEVADIVRRDLALRLLADPALSTDDIAALTGFSETSAFHRAFRRWTGATPAEYRGGRR